MPSSNIIENSTDATRGQPLAIRAQQRIGELKQALQDLGPDELRARNDIETAIGAAEELLTGDTEHLAGITAAELSRWLEQTKHLAEVAPKLRWDHS